MNEYGIAILCGIAIAALWALAYVFCWIGQWAWAWVDDSKIGKGNLIVDFLSYRAGYTDRGDDTYRFYTPNKELSDGCWPFMRALLLSSFIPLLAVLSFTFYPVFLAVMLLLVVAWVARFSRRHKKLFDEHIKDKDAHK